MFFDIRPVKQKVQMMMEGVYILSLAISLIDKGVLPGIALVLQISTLEVSQHSWGESAFYTYARIDAYNGNEQGNLLCNENNWKEVAVC